MSAHPWIEKVCQQCYERYRVPRWFAETSKFCSRACYHASLRKGPKDAA